MSWARSATVVSRGRQSASVAAGSSMSCPVWSPGSSHPRGGVQRARRASRAVRSDVPRTFHKTSYSAETAWA